MSFLFVFSILNRLSFPFLSFNSFQLFFMYSFFFPFVSLSFIPSMFHFSVFFPLIHSIFLFSSLLFSSCIKLFYSLLFLSLLFNFLNCLLSYLRFSISFSFHPHFLSPFIIFSLLTFSLFSFSVASLLLFINISFFSLHFFLFYSHCQYLSFFLVSYLHIFLPLTRLIYNNGNRSRKKNNNEKIKLFSPQFINSYSLSTVLFSIHYLFFH